MEAVARPPYNVIQPGTYSSVNATALAEAALTEGQPILAIVGTCKGGQPNTPLYFDSPVTAQNVLRSGKLYDAVRLAFRSGTSPICAIRIGKEVKQASLALAAITLGTAVTIKARDWGSWANAITIAVEAGPIVKLSYTDEQGNVYKQEWNLSSIESGKPTNAQVAEAINGLLPPFSASPLITAEAGTGTGGLKTASSAPLTSGSDGLEPEAKNWEEGLKALETEPISIVVAATAEATVHAQVAAHCEAMSTPQAKKRRTAIYGGALGETEAQTKERLKNLPYARAQLVWPGVEVPNTSGEKTLYDPFYAAAIVGGMHCALADQATSLVHAYVPVLGVEKALSTIQGGPIDQLLEGNVTPIVKAPGGGVWIVDSLSGYNRQDGVFRDFIKIRTADAIAEGLEAELRPFIGGKTLTGTAESIKAKAEAYLKRQVNRLIVAFQPVTVEGGPSQAPIVTSENSYNVGAPVQLVGTTKFIFIGISLQGQGV